MKNLFDHWREGKEISLCITVESEPRYILFLKASPNSERCTFGPIIAALLLWCSQPPIKRGDLCVNRGQRERRCKSLTHNALISVEAKEHG